MILRRMVEALPPEKRATFPEWKIDGILDAIEVVERYDTLIQVIRKAPCPVTPVFAERGGEVEGEKMNVEENKEGKG